MGISRDVMYGAAGTSNDFAHAAAGIPYCYLIELRSKKHKFKLPKEQIQETGNEIYNCVEALMEFVDSYKPKKHAHKEKILINKKEPTFNKSFPDMAPSASHIRKRESYDRITYSYAKKSDSFVQRDNSYIRWPNVALKKENPNHMSDNFTKVDSGSLDHYLDNGNEVPAQTVESDDDGDEDDDDDSFDGMKFIRLSSDNSGSFLHLNNPTSRKNNRFRSSRGSYLHKTDSYEKQTSSRHNKGAEKADSFCYVDDIFLKGSTHDLDSEIFLLADSQSPPNNGSQTIINKRESLNKFDVFTKETNTQVYPEKSNTLLNSDDSIWQRENSLVLQNLSEQRQHANKGPNVISSAFRRYACVDICCYLFILLCTDMVIVFTF